MRRRIGDRTTFAIEIGMALSADLRIVDVWAAGKRLTADDNVAYVPSLCHYLRRAAARVCQREIRPCPFPEYSPEEIFRQLEADETGFREHYWFMRWSETLDNVSSYAYLDDDLVIIFAFWRDEHPVPEGGGKVLVAKIPPEQFATIVLTAADLLNPQ
ncbi:hypothetical protein [Catellatospora tritici]|uniref:hypothetical protein n=1 Tax=Catellatospora tritici TaxID=2851566 RepID=UPI001C2D8734|nr:hypothetical protein [Catellatospora tritici]MBV1856652.1 hypothetical protein [Catellatospora tritici]